MSVIQGKNLAISLNNVDEFLGIWVLVRRPDRLSRFDVYNTHGDILGILLCRTKNDAVVEMTLPEGNQTIFASRYQLYLPSKEELKVQLEAVQD